MEDDFNQLTLFDVQAEYARTDQPLSNQQVYERLADKLGLSEETMTRTVAYGQAGSRANPFKRRVRWYQQELKAKGILEHHDIKGMWRMTGNARTELRENLGRVSVVGFSTELGVAIYGLCSPVFKTLDMPITLCLTSPPYLLRQARAYGNPANEQRYIDFICESLEPVVANLRRGGSICLNITNDSFLPRSPARSLYRERLVLALNERLGLWKMDELVWRNPNKPTGPVQWASKIAST